MTPSLRRESGDALRSLGMRPSRRLGQNFLVDRGVVSRIVASAEIAGETVVEIGPGLGALSDELAAAAPRLVMLELDHVMAERLRERFAGRSHVRVVQGDALRVAWEDCWPGPERAVVVANLPYRVGSQILLRLLDSRERFSRLVVMLQREVAMRIVARPGTKDYGLLSIWTRLYADARLLFRVGAGAFLPRPKVESAVLRIDFLDRPRVAIRDEGRFREVVRSAFGQRRKTLRRALAGRVDAMAFERAGIDPGRRGETLSLDEFARLADAAR